MIRYLLAAFRTNLRRTPSLHLLTVFGVALGVGSVLAIQILNQNALAAFAGSVQAVSGDADLSVVGRTPQIADSIYREVLADPGVAAAWPMVHVEATLADSAGVFVDVYGVDLFAPVEVPGLKSGRAAGAAGAAARRIMPH